MSELTATSSAASQTTPQGNDIRKYVMICLRCGWLALGYFEIEKMNLPFCKCGGPIALWRAKNGDVRE